MILDLIPGAFERVACLAVSVSRRASPGIPARREVAAAGAASIVQLEGFLARHLLSPRAF